jgi:hypothetical protein
VRIFSTQHTRQHRSGSSLLPQVGQGGRFFPWWINLGNPLCPFPIHALEHQENRRNLEPSQIALIGTRRLLLREEIEAKKRQREAALKSDRYQEIDRSTPAGAGVIAWAPGWPFFSGRSRNTISLLAWSPSFCINPHHCINVLSVHFMSICPREDRGPGRLKECLGKLNSWQRE